MRDGDAVIRQDLPFFGVHVHAVGGDDVRTQDAQLVEVAHRRGAVCLDAVLDLAARLTDVDVDQHVVVAGEVDTALEPFTVHGIDGMRAHHQLDAAAGRVLPVLDVVLEGFRLRFGMIVQDGDADGGADPGGLDRGHGLFGVEVHVREKGGAGSDHLPDSQLVAVPDVVRGQVGLEGPDVLLQPLLKRQVVRHPAHERHGSVGVRIEERRQDRQSVRLDDAVGRGILRGVQIRKAVLPDQDIRFAPVQQHVVQENALRHAEFTVQRLVVRQDGAGVLQEEAAALGRFHAPAAALEQRPADGSLQF